MKHPIAYRIVFYSCFVLLVGSVLYMVHLMKQSPYNEINMRSAYLQGCARGARPLSILSQEKCEISADLFLETLRDMDKQLDLQ